MTLRIRHHYSYHGLALNVALDLEPFSRINPCGYPGLRVTSLAELGYQVTVAEVRPVLETALRREFGSVGAQDRAVADNSQGSLVTPN